MADDLSERKRKAAWIGLTLILAAGVVLAVTFHLRHRNPEHEKEIVRSNPPGATALQVEWTNGVPIRSLADIDAALLEPYGFMGEPVEVKRLGGDRAPMTLRNCADYLRLVADGEDFEAGNRSDYETIHSNGLSCWTLQLLKNARPSQTSFLGDFNFTKSVINILPPGVALSAENSLEAEAAEKKGWSLEQFEPSLKVKDAGENELSVETKTWEGQISYLARGDFDGKGLEEVLIKVRGNFKEGEGPYGLAASLYVLTRMTNSGPLKVVREIQ